jgi:hypothetical protein
MLEFKNIFGISPQDATKHCILCNVSDIDLFAQEGEAKKVKGLFFTSMNLGFATVVALKNNFLAGDCVCALNQTKVANIYLFGSCGAVPGVELGKKILVNKSYDLEGFSSMLKFKDKPDVMYPDKTLLKDFTQFGSGNEIDLLNCATVGSLFLEEDYLRWFMEHKVACVDMEASIVFSAVNYIKRKSIALLYATDILARKLFFEERDENIQNKVLNARRSLSTLLLNFIKNAKSD